MKLFLVSEWREGTSKIIKLDLIGRLSVVINKTLFRLGQVMVHTVFTVSPITCQNILDQTIWFYTDSQFLSK